MHPDYRLSVSGSVRPPADIMAAARVELSEEGFARLMQLTGGEAPTPRQLVREVEFERYGTYPSEDVIVDSRVIEVRRNAFLIAAAMHELSLAGYRNLMLANDLRSPTPQQLCEAVEAERAAAIESSKTA